MLHNRILPGGGVVEAMTDILRSRMALGFSCIGHAFSHVFEPAFYVVALMLPAAFGISYEQALTLIVAGKLLFGLAAPVTGWMGDRWSATGVMVLFFLGTGGGAIWAGLARGPGEMALALAVMGAFASIYHPVGLAWLVRSVVNRGQALGINGAFGGFGPAFAAGGAGLLIDAFGWRSALIVPGLLCAATGLALWLALWRGWVVETAISSRADPLPDKADARRVYLVLSGVMLCGGLIYQATQAAMPKLFDERLTGMVADLLGDGASGVGMAVMAVYTVAGLFQIAAGSLADRHALKWVYLGMYLVQAPILALVATLAGLPLMVGMMMAVCANIGALPAENSLLAAYTPARWRSTAFGLKFVLSFGISALAVPMVSLVRGETGDFALLFWILAGLAGLAAVLILSLPRTGTGSQAARPRPTPAKAAAG